jgi:Rieske 2Fe-2S family protein
VRRLGVQQPARSSPEFRKTTETFADGSKTLPQRYFTSAEVLQEELGKIFARNWVLVGHQSQLASPGDYIVQQVNGESLIFVRDKGAAIHAFFNVCRHRGTRLIESEGGKCAAIQCPYHAWTYALDGKLIGAPHMDEVPGFDKNDYGLRPANAGIWEGFVFVNVGERNKANRQSDSATEGVDRLADWFAPLTGKFSQWNLPNLVSAKRIEYDVRANWKLIFENYSECYHCPGVHPGLSKLSPYDSAENDLSEGAFLGGFMKINSGKSLTMSGNACAIGIVDSAPDPDHNHTHDRGKNDQDQDQDQDHEDGRHVYYYSIFPNMLLSMHPDYVMVHQLSPQAPDRTLIYCDWFFHPEAAAQKNFNPNDAIEFWDMTNKQDWHVCELSQQGIQSRVYEPGPYSSRESIPAAWDRYYLSVMQP